MNALGDGAPRSVAEARAATGAGAPLRAALRATAPLTACLHDNALREWRAGHVASGLSTLASTSAAGLTVRCL